jgi:ribosomal protein L2
MYSSFGDLLKGFMASSQVLYFIPNEDEHVDSVMALENWEYASEKLTFKYIMATKGKTKISRDNMVAVTVHGHETAPIAFDFHKKDHYKAKVVRCMYDPNTNSFLPPVVASPSDPVVEIISEKDVD